MVVIQNENRIFINVFLFEFYDKFQWPIIKFEIGLVADFGYGNRKSKPAFKLVKTVTNTIPDVDMISIFYISFRLFNTALIGNHCNDIEPNRKDK